MPMETDSGFRGILITILFVLFAAIAFGLVAFFSLGSADSQVGLGWYIFSYAAGITMIVLPCTLPLAFVIVPLSMGKGPIKGLLIALFFGLGVALTLSMYGVVAAIVGQVAVKGIGAPLELVKNWLYFIAGIMAYVFALGQLGLINARMPSYTGAFPGFIQKQQDVLKAFLLGLFLGNIGIGCPHPATPFILGRIAVSGDIFYGWLLFFVHAIGRILPLIFLAILGVLGVNALASLVKHKDRIERATGWGMVFVAAFILVLGLFSHDWWVLSGMHTYLESLTREEMFLTQVADQIGGGVVHAHGLPPASATGLMGLPLWIGTWVMLALWIAPLFWNYFKKKNVISRLSDAERVPEQKLLRASFWNVVTLSLLLVVVFGNILPNRFLAKATMDGHMDNHAEPVAEHAMDHGDNAAIMDHEAHGGTMLHEENDITSGPSSHFSAIPNPTWVGSSTQLSFDIHYEPGDQGIPSNLLDVNHEKLIHVIGARSDLNEFFHIHPAASPTSSVFTIEHTFAAPGEYKIWSDFKLEGVQHVIGHSRIQVQGDGSISDAARNFGTQRIADGYLVNMHYETLSPGDNELGFEIKDSNGQLVELDNYLGAAMHLVIISDDLAQFVHAHPEEGGGDDHGHAAAWIPFASADAGHGSNALTQANFHTTFTAKGDYRAFAQFRPKNAGLAPDEAITAAFWIKVTDPVAASPLSAWWRNLIVSLVGMVALSWIVKKYVTIEPTPVGAAK